MPTAALLSTRRATVADLDAVAALFDAYRQFYEQPADLPAATAFMRERLSGHDAAVLLCERTHRAEDGSQGGEVIGFCQLYPLFCSIEAKPIDLLADLYVRPIARRTGAATGLLRAAERLSAQRGRVRMELTTARTNLAAQATYEGLGWVRDGVYLTYTKQVQASA